MGSRARHIRELSIRNIGVIDQASVSLGPGFNVITGETGAGKTMVLTGLNLIAGSRSDVDLIRKGSEKLSVSALVALEPNPAGELRSLIDEHDPEIEDGSLLLQRSLSSDGRSKAVVGSDPATLSLLQRFSSEIFVIHGQGSNHRLLDRNYQLEILDRTRKESQLALEKYREELHQLREKEREYRELKTALNHRDEEIESISRFIKEMERVRLEPGEWDDVETRINRLDSVEDLRLAISGALNALDDETHGVVNQLSMALRSLEQFKAQDGNFQGYGSRLRSARIEVSEVVQDLQTELSALDVDPGELDRLRDRRATMKQVLQRYRGDVPVDMTESESLDYLLASVPKRNSLLADLQGSDSRLAEIHDEIEKLQNSVELAAKQLSDERRIAAEELMKRVNAELQELGLTRSSFLISIQRVTAKDFLRDGIDDVEFLFSSHDSGKPLSLGKGASGGELSRVMLAIELALADHREIGTLIFDEIDAGIGGETGLIIGERLARLAEHFQIIVITHLAQVAAWADRHYRIEKSETDEIVLSSVTEVNGELRVSEIARMLSGQSDLAVARDHALELLKHAHK